MFDIILSSFDYVKGRSLRESHSQGIERCVSGDGILAFSIRSLTFCLPEVRFISWMIPGPLP